MKTLRRAFASSVLLPRLNVLLIPAVGVLPALADDAPTTGAVTNQNLKASADYNEALQRDPRDVANLIGRGEAFLREARGRQAFNDFNSALRFQPDNPDALAGRAQILVASKQPEMAIGEVSRVMARIRADGKESTAAKLFGARGAAFIALTRYDEALLDLNQAITLDSQPAQNRYSQNSQWYYNRALAWVNKKDDAHALADFGVAVQLKPELLSNLKGSKFEKTVKPHGPDATVLIANGDSAVFHKLRGNEWAAAQSFTEGVREFEKAIALDPQYADAYNNLGLAQMSLNLYDVAGQSMDKAITLKADDPRFYLNRSVLRLRQQRPKDAVLDAKQATQLDPQNAAFWTALATAQQTNADYHDAELSLTEALKMKEGKGPTFELHGNILVARALQNITPTKEELYALFYQCGAKKDDIKGLAEFLETEVKRHPGVASLTALRDAVVTERDRKVPYFVE